MFDQYRYPELLDQYHGVIVHVLNRLNVYPSKSYFDDLYQIAQIGLYQAAADFDDDPLEEEQHYRFTAYAKTVIRWRVLDELRRLYQQDAREQSTTEDWLFESGHPYHPDMPMTQDATLFLAEASKFLLDHERIFLKDVVQCQGNMKQLRAIYPISRQALYARKTKLAAKLSHFRHLLTD